MGYIYIYTLTSYFFFEVSKNGYGSLAKSARRRKLCFLVNDGQCMALSPALLILCDRDDWPPWNFFKAGLKPIIPRTWPFAVNADFSLRLPLTRIERQVPEL